MADQSSMTNNRFWLDRLAPYGLVLARLIVGYFWYDQLDWKMPPTFNCPPDFAVSTGPDARTAGLCDWTGLIVVYSKVPAHAALYENFINPNISWIGWFVWILEALTAALFILGLFSRLGAFLGLLQAINLYIGLSAAPFEAPWFYSQMAIIEWIFFWVPPGRTLGIDAWLRSRFVLGKDTRLSRVLQWVT